MLVRAFFHLIGVVVFLINLLHRRFLLCGFILLVHFLLSFTVDKWDSWNKVKKFSVIALWVGGAAVAYTIGNFLENRSYDLVVQHNQQIIHQLIANDFKIDPSSNKGAFASCAPICDLRYFNRKSFIASDESMLTPREKLHNNFIKYIKLRYFMEQRPDAFRFDDKPRKGKPRNPLGSALFEFRKNLLKDPVEINSNKYEEFSIFELQLFYAKLLFHYQEGEFGKIRSLAVTGGPRAMQDPTLKVFRILAAEDADDLASTLSAYRHHRGEIAKIAAQIDQNKLLSQRNTRHPPKD
jgi:hypothetical protein